jgi:hypothetical protein
LIVTETLKSGPRREHKCLPEKNQCADYTYFKANDGSAGYLNEVHDMNNRRARSKECLGRDPSGLAVSASRRALPGPLCVCDVGANDDAADVDKTLRKIASDVWHVNAGSAIIDGEVVVPAQTRTD